MKSELRKKYHKDPGSAGLPRDYPVPTIDSDLLFYMQRNQNENTIVYKINRNYDGLINLTNPMYMHWIEYTEGGVYKELNPLQCKLAFGYESRCINADLFQFNFVSYPNFTLYLVRDEKECWHVEYMREKRRIKLNNIYVYALEYGAFPDVKFVELFGEDLENNTSSYQKIMI